ncbi:MAG: SpoIIE family protein phosphatase, partial [Pseudomonadota bacterium]
RFEKPVVLMQPESVRGPLGRGFPSADPPPLLYREAGSALAAVDLDVGENLMVRKMRAVQPICGAPFLMLGAEALRQAQQGFYTVVRRTWSGMEVVLDDPANADAIRFPAERDGSFWLHFGEVGVEEAGGERVLRRYISAREVMAPEFDSQRLAGKIALLAVIDLGRIDERRAPIGSIIFGVEAHMQMIEQIVDRDFLRRPWFMPWAEAALLALLGLLVIWLVPLVRAQVSVALAGGLVAALLAGSAVAFRAGLLVDAASPAFGLSIVFVGVIAATLVDRDRQRLLAQLDLASERADRAFLQGELDAAARIQMALLPARRFQKPGLIDLACHIEPARTVGGDFYDHVLVDDRHLFFLVADVSGKGADASQFMLLSKTLWKSVALRTGAPLDRIQIEANAEITRENTATMFVTGLCGLLDLETGELSYSSAGHDQPFRFRPGVAPEQLESFSGPPAGLMDGITFPVGQVSLKAGDRLFIFSDGVTEAMDRSGRLYGLERLAQDLADAPTEADSSALVEHVLGRVRAFTGDAEQSDDLTIMALTIPEAGVAGGSE